MEKKSSISRQKGKKGMRAMLSDTSTPNCQVLGKRREQCPLFMSLINGFNGIGKRRSIVKGDHYDQQASAF
jgi:hypothetical protein